MAWPASGWRKFAASPEMADWIAHVWPVARDLTQDPAQLVQWLRCGGTWFAGVNLLPNDALGRVGQGPALTGEALRFVEDCHGRLALDRAQLSVIYQGYPKPMDVESPAAFRFRRDRDAAHVDGLLPVGPDRQRFLREPHAWVIGIPLNKALASPMVIWEGSHEIMRAAFRDALAGIDPAQWGAVDLTQTYHAARKHCFDSCARVEITAQPGESYAIHRLALHGVAPWSGPAIPDGRVIAYFRPELRNTADWLDA